MKKINLLTILLITFFISSCLVSKPQQTTVEENSTATILADSEGLKLTERMSQTKYGLNYHLHKAGYVQWDGTGKGPLVAESSYNTDCEISSSNFNTENADILCWLEANELELTFHGVEFQLAVPAGTCKYIETEPYWFWNYQPGSSNYTITIDVVDDDCTNNNDGNCTGGVGTGVVCDCGGAACSAITDFSDNQIDDTSKLCLFDYSSLEPTAGPNCDEGSVNYNVVSWTYDSDTNTCVRSTSRTEVDCSGSRYNCAYGPGQNFQTDSVTGIPISKISNSDESGLLSRISITDGTVVGTPVRWANWTRACNSHAEAGLPIASSTGDSSATYYADSLSAYAGFPRARNMSSMGDTELVDEYLENHGAPYSAITTTEISSNSTRLHRDAFFGAQPYYVWSCLDEAYEVQARIRLQIRAWDQLFTASSDGVNYVYPVISGVNKMDRGGQATFPDLPYTDYMDWDDAYHATEYVDTTGNAWNDSVSGLGGGTNSAARPTNTSRNHTATLGNKFADNDINCVTPSTGNITAATDEGHYYFWRLSSGLTVSYEDLVNGDSSTSDTTDTSE